MARTGLAVFGGVVGAIIGLPFGQPMLGAQLGFLVGGGVGAAVFPEKGPVVEGPRLRDLDVQSSAYGLPVALVFGTVRLAGNVIWAPPIKETRREAKVNTGGKGGQSSQTTVTYTNSIDCAVGICEGPIIGIRKVWGDTKLIYDSADDATVDEQLASQIQLSVEIDQEAAIKEALFGLTPGSLGAMKIYPGTQTAKPEPLIEADKGVGNVPAYRGLCYVVFDDFQLANFGNRIPNFSFEVVFAGTETTSEIASITVPISDGVTYERIQGPFLDGNGEVVCLMEDPMIGGFYTSTTFKMMRLIGSTLVDISKIPPLPGTKPAGTTSPAADARMPFKSHMDHHGFMLGYGSGTESWVGHWDTQTWTKFSGVADAFVFAQRGGDAIFLFGSAIQQYTSEGSRIGTGAANGNAVDIGISANWFWILDKGSGGRLFRVRKTDLATDATIDISAVSASALGNMDVKSDTLIYVTQGVSATKLSVFKIEIDNTANTAITTEIINDADFSVTALQANQALNKMFHLSGSLVIWGGDSPPTVLGTINFVTKDLSSTPITLSTIVSNLCVNAGLTASDIDVTALASTNVGGYSVAREATSRQALSPLQIAFSFDGVESDGKIKFVKRGGSSIETIPETQLSAREPSAEIPDLVTSRRTNEKELPRSVEVGYANSGSDHQQGMQRATRLITKSDLVNSIELAISMTDNEARQIADVLLYESWLTRHLREIKLSRRYLFLDPADVITVTTASATFVIRIGETAFGEPGVLSVRGVDESAAAFVSVATGGVADPTETPPALIGSTRAILLDLPLLRDSDDGAGFYMAARGYTANWPGCILFRSPDGGESFVEITPVVNTTPLGHATTVLASGLTTIFDEVSTVTVRLVGGVLSSATELQVLNGSNACVIGKEILQFKTATLTGDGDYDLSGFLRARRGTEQHIGTHITNDCFVLLQGTSVERVPNALTEINVARTFKAPTIGLRLVDADQIAFTDTGASLKPLSVVHVTATRNVPATDDITFAWIRRGRIGPEWRDLVDVPLGEDTESYSIDVFDNGTVLRILTSTSESVVYTSAQQTTDFGSPQSSVHVKIFQISADVGRGFETDFTG